MRKKIGTTATAENDVIVAFLILKICLFDPMEAMISDETYIGVDKESDDGRKCGEFHDDKIEFSNNIKNLRNDVISN